MPQPTDLLNVAQVAAELQIARRTVVYRIASGTLAAIKVGDGKTSAYVITRAEVERIKTEAAA